PGVAGRGEVLPVSQFRFPDADQAVPPGVRRCGVVLLRPAAALRAVLFGRSGASGGDAVLALRSRQLHRPYFEPARWFGGTVGERRWLTSEPVVFAPACIKLFLP